MYICYNHTSAIYTALSMTIAPQSFDVANCFYTVLQRANFRKAMYSGAARATCMHIAQYTFNVMYLTCSSDQQKNVIV